MEAYAALSVALNVRCASAIKAINKQEHERERARMVYEEKLAMAEQTQRLRAENVVQASQIGNLQRALATNNQTDANYDRLYRICCDRTRELRATRADNETKDRRIEVLEKKIKQLHVRRQFLFKVKRARRQQ